RGALWQCAKSAPSAPGNGNGWRLLSGHPAPDVKPQARAQPATMFKPLDISFDELFAKVTEDDAVTEYFTRVRKHFDEAVKGISERALRRPPSLRSFEIRQAMVAV